MGTALFLVYRFGYSVYTAPANKHIQMHKSPSYLSSDPHGFYSASVMTPQQTH